MIPSDHRVHFLKESFKKLNLPVDLVKEQVSGKEWERLKREPELESILLGEQLDPKPIKGISFFLFKSRDFTFYLDQELDYNRYRKAYLNLEWYKEFQLFNLLDQKVFCRKYENECFKHGVKEGNWTNPAAEKIFGRSGPIGDLGEASGGSAAWKLRALKNFIIDLKLKGSKLETKRLGIYDKVLKGGKVMQLRNIFLMNDPDLLINIIYRKVNANA